MLQFNGFLRISLTTAHLLTLLSQTRIELCSIQMLNIFMGSYNLLQSPDHYPRNIKLKYFPLKIKQIFSVSHFPPVVSPVRREHRSLHYHPGVSKTFDPRHQQLHIYHEKPRTKISPAPAPVITSFLTPRRQFRKCSHNNEFQQHALRDTTQRPDDR